MIKSPTNKNLTSFVDRWNVHTPVYYATASGDWSFRKNKGLLLSVSLNTIQQVVMCLGCAKIRFKRWNHSRAHNECKLVGRSSGHWWRYDGQLLWTVEEIPGKSEPVSVGRSLNQVCYHSTYTWCHIMVVVKKAFNFFGLNFYSLRQSQRFVQYL